jgi:RNA-directed DNA polymerase
MNLQEELSQWKNLWLAYENASRGKRGKGSTAEFEMLLADNLLELQKELAEKRYQPGEYYNFHIHEPKKRLISASPFRDRVIHHALCNITTPHFEKLFIKNSFANREGKGTHRALDACQSYARRYKYALQCDIKQFFPSLDHAILRDILLKMLPDKSVAWLIERIISSGRGVLEKEYEMVYFPNDDLLATQRPRGLPIGNLTSQWWANCYLNSFDHFVCRELSCKAYLRYVDDFILFSNDKKELMGWRNDIIERLGKYRLAIHRGSAHPKKVSEGLPFLGFLLYPRYRRLKSRKGHFFRRKMTYKLTHAGEEEIKNTWQGWNAHVSYGDTYSLRQKLLLDWNLLSMEN